MSQFVTVVYRTGLGLAISRQLVELMGGQLEVISVLGAGSTFTVCVPLRLTSVEALPQLTELAVIPVRPLQVLVAEDNPINQEVIRRMLGGPSPSRRLSPSPPTPSLATGIASSERGWMTT